MLVIAEAFVAAISKHLQKRSFIEQTRFQQVN